MGALIGTGVYLRKAEGGTTRRRTPEMHRDRRRVRHRRTGAVADFSARTRPGAHTPSVPPPASATPAEALPATVSATPPPAPPEASRVKGQSKSATRAAHVARPASTNGATAEPAAAQGNAASSAELDQLEQEIDRLTARAAAVNNSLDRLQQEQARQGLGLRGDMAARQQSMKLNLAKAQDALEKRDAARATRFKDQAENDVEALEKFLGR